MTLFFEAQAGHWHPFCKGQFPSPSIFFLPSPPPPPSHWGGLRSQANRAKINSPATEGYIHQADHLPAGVDVESVELYVRSYTLREKRGWGSGSFADEGDNPSRAGGHQDSSQKMEPNVVSAEKEEVVADSSQGPPTVLASGEVAQVGPSVRVQCLNLGFAAHMPWDFSKLISSITWE